MMTTSTRPHTGVLLVNLGTPDSPRTRDVRRYLREFLMDGRVIDVPAVPRWLLVNLIIAPFRAPKSAKTYREVWTENGSPLKHYGFEVSEKLQRTLGDEYVVALGMRYQKPSIAHALQRLQSFAPRHLIVIPLFPQYASATSGSVHDKVMEIVRGWQLIPKMTFVDNFHEHPMFLDAFAERGRQHLEKEDYDEVIFSYHGLPERQIRKGDSTGTCLKGDCCATLHPENRLCYRAQCFATSRDLAQRLGLQPHQYTVCFQSRLGADTWLQPYTEDVIKDLIKRGKKRVLAFSPAFVADCLETTIEIGEEYREEFEKLGGEHWQLVESLNDDPRWVETLHDLVRTHTPPAPEEVSQSQFSAEMTS